jgi:tyrosinase
MNLRKNIQNLTLDELQKLRLAFSKLMEIGDNRGFNYIAGIHGVPQFKCWHQWRRRGEQRLLPLFCPWHRAYLYWLEQSLQDQVPDVTLPWWDWSSSTSRLEGLPKAYSDKKDSAGKPNPLLKSRIFVPTANPPLNADTFRNPGNPSELPTKNKVDIMLSKQDFADFEDDLEDLHDSVHGWVGGSMGRVATAGFDPIFWAHHTHIDRLWRIWQMNRSDLGFPPDLLNEILEPFPFTVRDVLDVRRLGYEYASASGSS